MAGLAINVSKIGCPHCGAPEQHEDGKVHIRAYKVYNDGQWWSQCLVCSGGYDKIYGTFTENNHTPD